MQRIIALNSYFTTHFLPKIEKRILIMRKLLIQHSIFFAKGMPLSYHKYTVRLMEDMLAVTKGRLRGAK